MLNFLDKVFKDVHALSSYALERTMTMLTNNAFYATYLFKFYKRYV